MKFLIVCRVEQATNAQGWLSDLGPETQVELSTYGDHPEPGHHHYKGGKWAGIYELFQQKPELLEGFDYIWCPDDDIVTNPHTAMGFLHLCRTYDFELAQPALTPDSYFAYRETIVCPRFAFRRTNFVELMMPCMRKDFLVQILPAFRQKHAGLGLDWIWQNTAKEPCENVAIVDAFPMRHSRPRNLHLATNMSAQQINIAEERAKTFTEYGIQPLSPFAYSGQLRSGRRIIGNLKLTTELFRSYVEIRKRVINGRWTFKDTARLIVEQVRRSRRAQNPHSKALRIQGSDPTKLG